MYVSAGFSYSSNDFMAITQIAAVLEEAWAPEYTYLGVIVDTKSIQKLQVGFNLFELEALLNERRSLVSTRSNFLFRWYESIVLSEYVVAYKARIVLRM